jgi:nucleoid-associated protein YgaU
VVRVACGVAVVSAPLAGSTAAFADPPDPASSVVSSPTATVRLVPAPPTLPVLDRTVSQPAQPGTPAAPRAPRVVVVRSGDTLWSIAARHLGAHASDAEVAHEWRRWYAANADVIGPDPGLITPGQHLQTPGPSTRAAS